ncbi:two-component system phosphate regulon sensor histidine kinase PhoR [Alkalibacillus flavidus]|uniref:histidine kinase n=1 Tax=Alkalibacillus flavidus TaxID=546021 RepID=A0ABV2KV81_9BACI
MRTVIEKRTIILYIVFSIIMIVLIGALFNQIARYYVTSAYEDQLMGEAPYIAEQIGQSSMNSKQNTLDDYSRQFNVDLFYENPSEERILHTFQNDQLNVIRTIRNNTDDFGYATLINNRLMMTYTYDNQDYLTITTKPLPLPALSQTIWWSVFAFSLFTAILLWRFGNRLYDSYVEPAIQATETSKELASGNYEARVDELPYGVASELGLLVNRLGRHLQYVTTKYENQNSRLKTVVNNMESGVLLINEKGMTRLVNDAFINQFETKSIPFIGEIYYDVILQDQINNAIQEAIFTEDKLQQTIETHDGRFFELYLAPIKGQESDWRGVVIVSHEITEIKRLERVRKDFVANVSHELKTPVTSIQGFAETLLDAPAMDEEKRGQFLTIIKKETKRLNILVQDLLDLSVLEKEGYSLKRSEFDAQSLVEDVTAVVKSQIEANSLTLKFNCDHELKIKADYYRIYQLMLNLIHNAIQYTEEGGTITLDVLHDGESIVISVSDTGIGIPKSAHERIFERFYRVDKARSRHSGGTGLGLSIVKHIVEAHEGSIALDSEEGHGTTIYVTLPQ